ncbi:hypothetical protein J6590_063025, partial [Homalodisca vitripennis]
SVEVDNRNGKEPRPVAAELSAVVNNTYRTELRTFGFYFPARLNRQFGGQINRGDWKGSSANKILPNKDVSAVSSRRSLDASWSSSEMTLHACSAVSP